MVGGVCRDISPKRFYIYVSQHAEILQCSETVVVSTTRGMLKAVQFAISLIVAFTYVKEIKVIGKPLRTITCTVNKLNSIVNKHCTGFPVKRDRNMYSGQTKYISIGIFLF